MKQQHLHTPLVWFSGRMECVPWCVLNNRKISHGNLHRSRTIENQITSARNALKQFKAGFATQSGVLWRVKALERENEKLLKRLDRLHEQMEATNT